MKVGDPMSVGFPCGVNITLPPNFLSELATNEAFVAAVNKAAGNDPKGPILDAIIALLPTILPIVLPLILQSFGAKENGVGPVCP